MFGFGKRKKRTMNEEEEKKGPEAEEKGSAAPLPEAAAEAETVQESASADVTDKPEEPNAEAAGAEENPEEAKSAPEEKAEEPAAEPDWKERYARTLADFDNYRKRMARDREELAQFAAKDILKDLLSTVDNLALALDKAENKEDPFVQGVKLAYDGFLKVLADHGATPLDSVGEPFDTNFHDALAQLPSADVPEGTVMNEVKRGWLLHGKLLRPAQVVVSSGAPAQPAEA